MRICVFGAASNRIDKKYIDDCRELARKLGSRGHNLVFGAGGEGLMGAAAQGFKESGARLHGVIPQFFIDSGYEAVFKELDEFTLTQTMAERKRIMEDEAESNNVVVFKS